MKYFLSIISILFLSGSVAFAATSHTAVTSPAQSVGPSSALLEGSASPASGFSNSTYFFEWGTNSSFLDQVACLDQPIPANGFFSCPLGGLSANSSYFYRAVVRDSGAGGTTESRGSVIGFTTPSTSSSGATGGTGSTAASGSPGGSTGATGGAGATAGSGSSPGAGTSGGSAGATAGPGSPGGSPGATPGFGSFAGQGSPGGSSGATAGTGASAGQGTSGGEGATAGEGSSPGAGPDIPGLPAFQGSPTSGGGGGSSAPSPTPGSSGLVPCGTVKNEDGSIQNPCTFSNFADLYNNVMHFLLVDILIPLATLAIAFVGIQYITAVGNPGKLEKAHGVLIDVLWGIFIAIAAYAIIQTIFTVLTGGGIPPITG